jgi:lipoprotein-anchoring transpeptidase ErfK/SrfK
MKKFPFLIPLALAALGLLGSCVHTDPPGTTPMGGDLAMPPQPAQPLSWANISYWDDDGSTGEPWMLVDLGRQVATFYRGGNRIGAAAISSGTEERQTPAGEYRILEKLEEKYSTKYGHIEDPTGRVVNDDAMPTTPVPPGCRYVPAPMPYWMRLTSTGVGMHQGFLPGYAASHGCIRMDRNVVQKFYHAAHVGMRVKVVR